MMEFSESLVVPIAQTTDGIAVKFFTETILLLKVGCSEEFLNRCKIYGMVNGNSHRCNLLILKIKHH